MTARLLPTLEVVALLVAGVFFICAGIVMLQVGLDNLGLLAWLHTHPEASGVGLAISRPEWGDFGIFVWRNFNEMIHRFCMSFRAVCPLDAYMLERIANAQIAEGAASVVFGAGLLLFAIHRMRPRGRKKPPTANSLREQP